MIRSHRIASIVAVALLTMPLLGRAADVKPPLPRAGYIDAMAGQPVKPDGSGPDLYVRTYTSVGYDSYIATATEAVGGKVTSYKFYADTGNPKIVHLLVLVKGTLTSDGKTVRYARVDVTKGTAGTFTVGGLVSASPVPTAQTTFGKPPITTEAPVVGGGVSFK